MAVDFLDRLEENARFQLDAPTAGMRTAAESMFRRHERLSFVDAALIGYADTEGLDRLYAFDSDFDAVDGVARLASPTDPPTRSNPCHPSPACHYPSGSWMFSSTGKSPTLDLGDVGLDGVPDRRVVVGVLFR